MNVAKAKSIVQKKFPGYKVEWCIPYRNSFVVMAHPNEGPEDDIHGAYPDPYYAVNKITGSVRPFVPASERDFGRSFFDTVVLELRKQGGVND